MERITDYKVLVIGSGPAGCTAAIYLSRANLAPLVLEGLQPGGQLTITTDVENYPGFPEGMRASKIMQERARSNPKISFLFNTTVEEVIGTKEEGVKALKLKDLKSGEVTNFPTQGLFVAIGPTPNTSPYKDTLTLDGRGYITLPHAHSTVTNVQGVFACGRSEEHTSELQSHSDIVCRLL